MAWTPQQIEFLQLGKESGMTWRAIGQHVGKSGDACREKFSVLQGKRRERDPGPGDAWNPGKIRHQSLAFAIAGAPYFEVEI